MQINENNDFIDQAIEQTASLIPFPFHFRCFFLVSLKEITAKPVIGIGEASMKIATMLGHRFSLITTDQHSIPLHETLINKYHLGKNVASVKAPDPDRSINTEEEKYLTAAKAAIQKDMAEVIVLGCAGMTGLDKKIQNQLGVPVLDGIICALMIIEGIL